MIPLTLSHPGLSINDRPLVSYAEFSTCFCRGAACCAPTFGENRQSHPGEGTFWPRVESGPHHALLLLRDALGEGCGAINEFPQAELAEAGQGDGDAPVPRFRPGLGNRLAL